MARLEWDKTGERFYQLGVSNGVLFPQTKGGAYGTGVVWNGLTGVTASPDGAEPNDLHADNFKYGSIWSAETFNMTIKAYTYPDEFAACDGSAEVAPGVYLGQQKRTPFAFSWQSLIGNDTDGQDAGYILHLVWGATAKPSDQDYETVNDNPDAIEFSWECDTNPVKVSGHRATAHMEINSLKANAAKLEQLLNKLYGTVNTDPTMPSVEEVIKMFS